MKKKPVVVIFGIILVFSLIVFFTYEEILKDNTKKNSTTRDTTQSVSFEDITPGKTTINDLVQNIGSPISQSNNDGNIYYEYYSDSPNFRHEVQIDNNIVEFVREIITSENKVLKSDLIKKYGKTIHELYGKGSPSGQVLYVYPSTGIAFIGYKDQEYILEIWHFSTTNIDDFRQKYAEDYFDTPQVIQ